MALDVGPRRVAAPLVALAAATLMACPGVPRTNVYIGGADATDGDAADGSDADVVIPLELDKVFENAGDPEGGERISLFGAGFEPGAKVYFGEELAGGVLVMDGGQINCDAPAQDPGLVDVTVELLDERTATLEDAYLYRAPLELESISPTEGLIFGAGVVATITGEGFDEDTVILVGGRLLENQVLHSDTLITGEVPARLHERPGPVDVIASNGFEQRVLVRGYRFVDELRVDWISPNASKVSGGSHVTLYGSGFEPGTGVRVDGTVAEIVAPGTGDVLVLRVPPHLPGPVDLEIDTGYGVEVLEGAFTYVDEDLPVGVELLNAWPVFGATGGGTQVALTVSGMNADPSVSVTFDAAPAEVLDVRPEEDTVVVAIPEGEVGAASIVVTVDGVSASRDDVFEFVRTLAVDAVVPASALPIGGKNVILEGEGFTDASVVRIGGRTADVVKVTETELTVEVPPGSPGLVDLRVEDPFQHVFLSAGFEYRTNEPARLLGVSSPDGSQAGGRFVRLFGTGFTAFEPMVVFGEFGEGEEPEVIDDATIHVRVPRGEIGSVIVDLEEAGRLAMAYDYFDPTAFYGGTGSGPQPEAINVTVVDLQTREPIEQAYVILWDDIDTPYQGLTDFRGQVTFSDPGFGGQQMVTAAKDQYTTASVVDFDARNVTLFLMPLVAAPPAPGGPGPGPQPLPDGNVAGTVNGFDKFIIPPLGSCDPKLESGAIGAGSALCQECEEDADCHEPGAKCTFLGDEGNRCTIACDTQDDCPDGFACTGVSGGAVQCVPAPGVPTAWCGTTIPDVFADESERPGGFTNGNDFYELVSAPGEHAIVCFGGYMDPDVPDLFIPVRMGVRRHVFTLPGDFVGAQDVVLDIPLTRTLKLRLDDTPTGSGQPDHYEAEVFLDLGPDGVFPMFGRIACVDAPASTLSKSDYLPGAPPPSCEDLTDGGLEFSLPYYPEKFEDSLYDASYAIYAKATTRAAYLETSNTASHTLHQDVTQVDEDTLVEIVEGGVLSTATGVAIDVESMHGPGDERVWAVSSTGEIVMWNGNWWGIQAWFDVPMRAVWGRSADDAWAAGDGLVAHWDGLVWSEVTLPDELAGVSWWAIDGLEDARWLVGDSGVWRHDAEGWHELEVGPGVTPSAVRDLWVAGPDDVWLVGVGGLIRRITAEGAQLLDQPGDQLLAIHGLGPDDVWAVGEHGRLLHWDGLFWFDYLPKTRRDLRAVHGVATDEVWAVGDAGVILRWDGALWTEHPAVEHMDLKGVWVAGDGRVRAGGAHILLIGPFLAIPRAINPTITYDHVSLLLEWQLPEGPEASFTYLQLTEGGGFPFWQLMVDGYRTTAPLPDLEAAWGLGAIWPGPGFMRMIRVYMPEFDIDAFDNTDLSQYVWRSWATEDYPVFWETSPTGF